MNKAFIKCALVAMLWGAFQAVFFLGMESELLLSDIVIFFGFSDVAPLISLLLELTLKLFPFFLFLILFGTYIYQHFCTASIYYFTRRHNRVNWFFKECVKLYGLSLMYPLIMVLSGTALASMTNTIITDQASFILLLYYVLIHSLWLFLTALFMNIIAIKRDSSFGFIVIVSLQMAFVTLLLLWDNLWSLEPETPNLALHGFLLQFNPISHLILSWHSSSILEVHARINDLNINFNLNTSLITFFIMSIIAIGIGSIVVKKQEWITVNNER